MPALSLCVFSFASALPCLVVFSALKKARMQPTGFSQSIRLSLDSADRRPSLPLPTAKQAGESGGGEQRKGGEIGMLLPGQMGSPARFKRPGQLAPIPAGSPEADDPSRRFNTIG